MALSTEVQAFIIGNIDSVAQLEALLLLRSGVGETWRIDEHDEFPLVVDAQHVRCGPGLDVPGSTCVRPGCSWE